MLIDVDLKRDPETILLTGVPRSGTTWIAELINPDHKFRDIFEPFTPGFVAAARPIEHLEYLRATSRDRAKERAAERIIRGRFRSVWSDRFNTKRFYTKRLIKDVRANLMLSWLRRLFPRLPIVFIVRHPLAVVSSFKRLGWGQEPGGDRREIDVLMSQQGLLADFPVIREIYAHLDKRSYVAELAFLWGVQNLVPLSQRDEVGYHLCIYEQMRANPRGRLSDLYGYLALPFHDGILNGVREPSKTNLNRRSSEHFTSVVTSEWNDTLTSNEIDTVYRVVQMFPMEWPFIGEPFACSTSNQASPLDP